jgi:DNA-binding GntR family transcriptional regulator
MPDLHPVVVPLEGAGPPRSLHDRITGRLRDAIVEGELLPGARINEREICERLSVSRTPLREALKVLASEGLIDLLPNRGARVAQLSEQDVTDMFEVMGSLESLSGALAAERITDAEISEIGALHYRMQAQYQRRQLAEYFRLNQAIHEAIMDASRNAVLKATYLGLAGRIRRARYLANMSEVRWAEAMAEHAEIFRALEARDGARLAGLLGQHLKNKASVVQASLTVSSPAPAAEGHKKSRSQTHAPR